MDTPIIPEKRCSKCGNLYPATTDYFSPQKSGKYGLKSWCKQCNAAYQRTPHRKAQAKARRDTPEYKEWRKEYRQRPHVKLQMAERARRPEVKERQRLYRLRPDIQQRRHEQATSEERRQKKRLYRASPDGKAKTKSYTQSVGFKNAQLRYLASEKGKAKQTAAGQRRRAKKNNLPSGYRRKDWQNALIYFDGCCAVCGRPAGLWHTLAADHWIPISSPDCPGTVPTNIVPLCHGLDGCNNSKSNREPVEWLLSKFGKQKTDTILKNIQAYFDSLTK